MYCHKRTVELKKCGFAFFLCMAMVLGSENTAGHFGFIYAPKLKRLKMVLWNLGQLGNHPNKIFQPPKQDGYMKTVYGGLLLT